MLPEEWKIPPPRPVLARAAVHVWRLALDIPRADLAQLEGLLSPDERSRAERFHFPRDRERYIACRGQLRVLLGRYLDREPQQVCFRYGVHGKPTLTERSGGDGLRFNLAHTDGLALYAVTGEREVGIDVERLRSDLDCLQIADHFFSPREVAVLRALPSEQQFAAFFKCWTCKEAYLKAHGAGLTFPLRAFDVELRPGEPAALLRTDGDPGEAARWTLRELAPGPGYAAALALDGHDGQLACWQCTRSPGP